MSKIRINNEPNSAGKNVVYRRVWPHVLVIGILCFVIGWLVAVFYKGELNLVMPWKNSTYDFEEMPIDGFLADDEELKRRETP